MISCVNTIPSISSTIVIHLKERDKDNSGSKKIKIPRGNKFL